MPKVPHAKPIDVSTEGGEVLLDGPEGLAESLTPDAARKSADRLREAARDADAGSAADPEPEING